MKDVRGDARWVTANLIDVLRDGCGLALATSLASGSTVLVRGRLSANSAVEHLIAGVRWCVAKTDGTFRAGLEFLDCSSTPEWNVERTSSPGVDCYEAMQLSPNADRETISRVYRMLAFRYHPDNAETGNSEMFLRLSEAHEILSEPEKRARYDLRYRKPARLRPENINRALASAGSDWDKRVATYLGVGSSPVYTVCWEG